MNKKNGKTMHMLAVVVILGGAMAVYAACTHIQMMPTPVCSTNQQCASYSTPVGVTCVDIFVETGGKSGKSSTNTVTVTTYSGGTCGQIQGSLSYCSGGTQTGTSTNSIVNHYCEGCPQG